MPGWTTDSSTLDLFGDGFVLLRLGANPPDATRLIEAAKARGVPMRAVTLADPEVAALYENQPGAGAAGRPRRLARQRHARGCRRASWTASAVPPASEPSPPDQPRESGRAARAFAIVAATPLEKPHERNRHAPTWRPASGDRPYEEIRKDWKAANLATAVGERARPQGSRGRPRAAPLEMEAGPAADRRRHEGRQPGGDRAAGADASPIPTLSAAPAAPPPISPPRCRSCFPARRRGRTATP